MAESHRQWRLALDGSAPFRLRNLQAGLPPADTSAGLISFMAFWISRASVPRFADARPIERWCVLARVKGGLNGVAKRRQNPTLNRCPGNVSRGNEGAPTGGGRRPTCPERGRRRRPRAGRPPKPEGGRPGEIRQARQHWRGVVGSDAAAEAPPGLGCCPARNAASRKGPPPPASLGKRLTRR